MLRTLFVDLVIVAGIGIRMQGHENNDRADSNGKEVFEQSDGSHRVETAQKKVGASYSDAVGTFHGRLKELSKKRIVIETDGNHLVSIRRTGRTTFRKNDEHIKPSDIDLETAVAIDVSESSVSLSAIHVSVDSPPQRANMK
jgi:hypothetical protein